MNRTKVNILVLCGMDQLQEEMKMISAPSFTNSLFTKAGSEAYFHIFMHSDTCRGLKRGSYVSPTCTVCTKSNATLDTIISLSFQGTYILSVVV